MPKRVQGPVFLFLIIQAWFRSHAIFELLNRWASSKINVLKLVVKILLKRTYRNLFLILLTFLDV